MAINPIGRIRVNVIGARGALGIDMDVPATAGQYLVKDAGSDTRKYVGVTPPAAIANAVRITDLAASSGSSLVGFMQSGTGAIARSLQQRARETVSVMDFGAVGDGVTNDTAAFDKAFATGKRVLMPIPPVGYGVDGIKVIANMDLQGGKSGECLGPELIVINNGGCVFKQTSTSEKLIPHLVFRDFTMRAGDGISGATGFRSMDQTDYSGYVQFHNIETHRSLLWGYDALFIYALWSNCRDGYLPGIGDFSGAHGFIKSDAPSFAQENAANTNNVRECIISRAIGVDASIQISKGDSWTFTGVRWENMDAPAIRARSVRKLVFNQPRSEGSRMTTFMVLQEMAGSGGVGTTAIVRDGYFAMTAPNFMMADVDNSSRVGFKDSEWSFLAAGSKLINNPLTLTANENNSFAGAGASGFVYETGLDRQSLGIRYFNDAVTNNNQNLEIVVNGGVAANQGFASGNAAVFVGGDWVNIFTTASIGGLFFISGVQTSPSGGSGQALAWVVVSSGGLTLEMSDGRVTPGNAVVAEFRMIAGVLQMRCSAGGANVTASALV